ncbi:MAG: peptidoglycan DD-metalloendopeptidase family protein [Brevefilum sp.]|nr:peptidoglycan DD-metalloendopeptidase family protein [Brevefilum sp.]
MMRFFFVTLILVSALLLSLSGCGSTARSYGFPEQAFVFEDEEKEVSNPPGVALGPGDQAAAPAPEEVNDNQKIIEQLSCGETYCQMKWPGMLLRPFSSPDWQRVDLTYPYGSTSDGRLAIHHGVEFPNPYGTAVRAAAGGEVVFAGTDDGGLIGLYQNFYGNVVVLKHPGLFNGEALYTLYGHLSSIEVAQSESLEPGDILGKVGASGVASGSHLHFEVRSENNNYASTTNPILWFSPLVDQDSAKTGTIAGRILDRFGKPVSETSITLQKLDRNGAVVKTYYLQTYAQDGINPHPALAENFALPDVPPGDYRLSVVVGTLYEVLFTLEPGMLGFINLQVK